MLAAVEFLKSYPSTSKSRIGLIGHSEGGMIAPMVAVRSKDVAFEVLLAGPGVTGEQILYEQAATLAQSQGASAEQVAQARAQQERIYGVLKSETDVAVMRDRIRAISGEASAQPLTSPWFRFFLTYDPATALRSVKIPTLALNGEKDVQVPFKQNLPAIEAALKAGGNTDVTVRLVSESEPPLPDEQDRPAKRVRADRGDDGACRPRDDRGLDPRAGEVIRRFPVTPAAARPGPRSPCTRACR